MHFASAMSSAFDYRGNFSKEQDNREAIFLY